MRLLCPPLALAVLVLTLAGAATLGYPLKWVVPVVWASLPWIGLALLWAAGGFGRGGLLLGVLGALSSWLVIMDITWHPTAAGMLSIHPDTWSYECLADFLYHYPRTRQPLDMPLIDQYGGGLYNSRFGAPSILAFLGHAPFLDFTEEVPFAHHAYCVICLAIHFFSFTYLMRALGSRWQLAISAGVLATAGGWLSNLIIIGNYDNLLFLSLAPAWLGLATGFQAGTLSGPRFAIAGAVCLAALFYVYPEGFLILSTLTLPLLVSLVWSGVRDRRRTIALAAFAVLFVLLVAPYAPTFRSFAAKQIATGTQATHAARPGSGNFAGLLKGAQALPATFALGDEFLSSPPRLTHGLLAGALVVLAATGMLALRKAHPWFPWVAVCVAGFWFWQAIVASYDYGAYKVIICASWWIYAAVSAGAGWRLLHWGRTAVYAGFALLLTAIGAEKLEDRPFRVWHAFYSLDPSRELYRLDRVIGHAPILFAVTDDLDYMWASVYLRGYPLGVTKVHGYYTFSSRKLRGPAPEDCRYVLVSGSRPGALWHNSRFSLLPNGSAQIDRIENPNGLETAGLRGMSPVAILRQPNGDTRELLLGVLGPHLRASCPPPAP